MDISCLVRSASLPAAGSAERTAVSVEGHDELTYAQLTELVNRHANGLLELGVRPGDRVGLLLYNCVEYWVGYFATVRLGAVSVRLNFRLSEDELSYALNDSGCSVLLVHSGLTAALEGIRDRVPVTDYICMDDDGSSAVPVPAWCRPSAVLAGASAEEPPVPLPVAADPAMLMYTSGTTGRPKGALWSHGNTTWIAAMQAMHWSLGPTAVSLTTGPMYHVGAFEDLLLPTLLTRGETIVCRSTGFDIGRILALLDERKVTHAFLYPFMIYELLRHPSLPDTDLSALRLIITGGSAIAAWAIEKLAEVLPDVQLNCAYGLTEGGAIATVLEAGDVKRRPDAVGRPLPGTEIRIADDDGKAVAAGTDAEVWIRSPAVCLGYWNKPEATAETFVEGWCRTGDLGHLTDDGLLVITGRMKDMIKSGGENIYPAELEQLLARHEAIADCAVIGVPDVKLQEAVCAVIVPAPGATVTPEIVTEYCLAHLARYKRPRHVVIIDALPRNAAGKIQKVLLRERYGNRGDQPDIAARPEGEPA